MGYPIINTQVTIVDGKYSEKRSSSVIFEMCAAQLLKDLIKKSNPVLLEPVMDIDISTPTQQASSIMNDIVGVKRGRILDIKEEIGKFGESESQKKLIIGVIPLVETLGYSTYLRSISKVFII